MMSIGEKVKKIRSSKRDRERQDNTEREREREIKEDMASDL